MKIIVDADACPREALDICCRLGKIFKVPVLTVASFEHQIDNPNHITVGNSPEETDLKISNLARPSDIAITQDWGLASILLGNNVRCLTPNGKILTDDNIETLLEIRNLNHRFRKGGGRTKGPKKRSGEDNKRFEKMLKNLLKSLPPE